MSRAVDVVVSTATATATLGVASTGGRAVERSNLAKNEPTQRTSWLFSNGEKRI